MKHGVRFIFNMTKRVIDIVLSLTGLILLLPVLILIGIWIKLDSPGPVLYVGERMGQNGRPFPLYKFRTMHHHCQPVRAANGAYLVLDDDPRVTRIGRVLRVGLDELPQLVNVLLGQMSLIGPRADPPEAATYYTHQEQNRLSVKPGITGLAQVNGRTQITLAQRRSYDLAYIEHPSFTLETCIFLLTLFELLPFLAHGGSRMQHYLTQMSLRLAAMVPTNYGQLGEDKMNTYWESFNIQKQYARRILLDCILIPAAFYLALLVQNNGSYSTTQLFILVKYLIPITAVYITINALSHIYRRLWAFADLRDAWHVLRASAISSLLLWGGDMFFSWFPGLGSGVIIIAGLLNAFFSIGFKYRRLFLPASHKEFLHSIQAAHKHACAENGLIIGTNAIARQIASQFTYDNRPAKINILGFVNDDPEKNGMTINGVPVLGTLSQIPELVKTHAIDVIIIAVEAMNHDELWHLITICQETPAQIKVLPTVTDLMNQRYEDPLTLRELHVEDLLQRRPLQIDTQLCRDLIQDKVVLVTGAAGSIGSELCYQLCRYEPAQLLLLDNNETGLFELNLDLNRKHRIPIQLLLADITDQAKMESIFQYYQPQLVFHAAAYKHVPLVEMNPDQSLRVNIKGTMIVSQLAHQYEAQRFVFISTDKAVKPKSVMGASKYACEIWLRALDKQSCTIFSTVRFGNVIGSRGSVLPIFANQIEQGGPVTITHKEMKRFFMSIPEAVNLVLQAAAFGQGGEVFMLDMGEEVRIQDLAERMIRLKGLRVHKDIPIEYIGVRPGEKLHEVLSYDEEEQRSTHHSRIYQLQANGSLPSLDLFQKAVHQLEIYPQQNGSTKYLHQGIFYLATQAFDQLVPPTQQPPTAVPDLSSHLSKVHENTFA